MAGPSQVEFPGKQRQRMRMRGTKQANVDTQKRIRKNLDVLLEDGESLLPKMSWSGKLSWGRTDPVTKTMREINKVLSKRQDRRWLARRMMAKRGDPLAKAWAGSLIAAHEDEISIVGDFKHPSFGKASFIRKGDGKPLYLAAIQNHHMPTLRMAAWENHAKRGFYFFSWRGGFVCSGPKPSIPEGWLDEVLSRSRFVFKNDGDVWYTAGLDPVAIKDEKMSGEGYILLEIIDGSKVAIGFDRFQKKAKSSFIHHLALSVLPPNLRSILTPKVIWAPKGHDGDINEGALAAADVLFDAWLGLTLGEAKLDERLKMALLNHIDEGIIMSEMWFDNPSDALKEATGSEAERELANHVLIGAMGSGIRINAKGATSEREGNAIEIISAPLNSILHALWENHGLQGLIDSGIDSDVAEELWSEQLEKKIGFGRFLKDLDKRKVRSDKMKVFPYERGAISGVVGTINDLILTGLIDGQGKAERIAISNRKDIDDAAAGWAWLTAAGRSKGKEWQFENNAREKGGAWAHAVKGVLDAGLALLNGEESDYDTCLKDLYRATGQNEKLP